MSLKSDNSDFVIDATGVGSDVVFKNDGVEQARVSGIAQKADKNQCTAWVNFDGAGIIKDSFNVASVVKNAVGDYTVTFIGTMANLNYGVVGTVDCNPDSSGGIVFPDYVSITTTTFRIVTGVPGTYASTSISKVDGIVMVDFFGGR